MGRLVIDSNQARRMLDDETTKMESLLFRHGKAGAAGTQARDRLRSRLQPVSLASCIVTAHAFPVPYQVTKQLRHISEAGPVNNQA